MPMQLLFQAAAAVRKELPGLAVDIHMILWFSMYTDVQNGTISLGYLKMVHGEIHISVYTVYTVKTG